VARARRQQVQRSDELMLLLSLALSACDRPHHFVAACRAAGATGSGAGGTAPWRRRTLGEAIVIEGVGRHSGPFGQRQTGGLDRTSRFALHWYAQLDQVRSVRQLSKGRCAAGAARAAAGRVRVRRACGARRVGGGPGERGAARAGGGSGLDEARPVLDRVLWIHLLGFDKPA
jgi:hypothetical protein